MNEEKSLKAIVESILFVSEEPLNAGEILKLILKAEAGLVSPKTQETESESETKQELEESVVVVSDELSQESVETLELEPSTSIEEAESEKLTRAEIQTVLEEIQNHYQSIEYGFELVSVAGGFQFRTKPSMSPYIRAMNQSAPSKLSQAALESMAMVAYRQPITRAEIDQLRGVDSGGVLKTLLDRELVRIVGKKEEAGKPLLYGTTDIFLETFQLKSLQDLPTLRDLKQIEEEMNSQAPNSENNVALSDDFFDEVENESVSSDEFVKTFADLQLEEEETFKELDEKIRLVDSLEQEVLVSITPKPETVEEPS